MLLRRRRAIAVLLGIQLLGSAGPGAAIVQAADPVVVGAGDIADCDTRADSATATLLDGIAGTVVTLGDNVYDSGTSAEFRDCYGPTWGRHRTRTRPAAGNHDYRTPGAAGYFRYFGASAGAPAKGYYAYDLGTWHVVVLNSNCAAAGGCGASSPQGRWLQSDLAANAGRDVLAYWHHPRFSSGVHGGTSAVRTLWEILYGAGADVVLAGHDHHYERFAPQDPWGRADPAFGIREFVVGTGGGTLRGRGVTAHHSEAFSSTHGVLRLTLRDGAYDWAFIPVAGSAYTDRGSGSTHAAPPPRTTHSFSVTSDAYVDQAHPGTNYGYATRLRVDGDTGAGSDRHAYLKATVTGVTGRVDRAALRVWVADPTRDGPRVYPTTTTWSGKTITWRTRPAATGAAASDARRIERAVWVDLDVTSIVHGDGTYGFLVRPTSGDGLDVEALQGTHPPRLIVQTLP